MISIKIARVTAVSVMAITALAALVAPASAAQAPSIRAGYTAVGAVAAKPNSNITGKGKAVKYAPTSLNVKWSGSKPVTCTTKKISFSITNTTKTTETVTMSGKTFASIPAGKAIGVCAFGTGTATGVLGLKANKKAKLTVNIS
jgi:hypothetical protein